MRSIIIIAVLAVLAACYGAIVLPSGEGKYPEHKVIYKDNKDDGVQESIMTLREEMRDGDDEVLLHEQRFLRTAIPDVIQNVDILYYGKPNTVITTIAITSSPPPSLLFPVWHLDNYISVRISSQRGLGLNGTARIYGTLSN